MTQDQFAFITAALYWCLIACWLIILIFYWREHRRLTTISPIVATMVVVIFLDGARTLLESIYFGTWYTARTRLIPYYLWDKLSEPQLIIIPKLINLIAALVIIAVLVRRWFPNMAQEIERHHHNEQLYADLQQAYAELQSVQTARDALSHMIVHDMRTPLTSMITGLQMAEHVTDDPALVTEMIEGAEYGAEQLLHMVNSLLDVNKMESGEMVLEPLPTTLADLVNRARIVVQPLAADKNVEIAEELPDATQILTVDPDIIRRVLVNLLGNAIKFTPEGGRVNIRSEKQPEGGVRLTITDTGPGIPAEFQDRIFEKFYQVPSRDGARTTSTGLGLTFSKLAVEAHGGRIGVTSEPGRGSSFWIALPPAPRT